MDDPYVLCSLPPKCILFEGSSTNHFTFPGIGSTASPIFCTSTSVQIQDMSVVRHQVPVTPAWAITDYKVQGSTYDTVTLDLHRRGNYNSESHRRYCSNYVQLSRVKTLAGLNLLQPVTLGDLSCNPDKLLVQEDQRIARLAMCTEISWAQIESNHDFK
jgi:hypothetical protein